MILLNTLSNQIYNVKIENEILSTTLSKNEIHFRYKKDSINLQLRWFLKIIAKY